MIYQKNITLMNICSKNNKVPPHLELITEFLERSELGEHK